METPEGFDMLQSIRVELTGLWHFGKFPAAAFNALAQAPRKNFSSVPSHGRLQRSKVPTMFFLGEC